MGNDRRGQWSKGVDLLDRDQSGVVLIDRQFLEPDWQGALQTLLLTSPAACVVPIMPKADDQFFEELIRQGGYDVLPAPLTEAAVVETIQFAWMY